MKVITAEHFGICFGVRDAIAQAQALAREAPLTILGELVHNPIVREQLRLRAFTKNLPIALRKLPASCLLRTALPTNVAKP